MTTDPLMMACVGDVSGMVRGKGFPVSAFEKRVEKGVGWTPTNVQITCFDTIADSPYGSLGDLVLWPERTSFRTVRLGEAEGPEERYVLGDIAHLDGTPWECCLRSMLKRALADLEALTGWRLVSTFEHEFMFAGGRSAGAAFSLSGFRHRAGFGEAFMGALGQAGIVPDSFLREYGPGQYEVTVDPAEGVEAADQAMMLRELARATAALFGEEVTFTPLIDPTAVGNGVHVHFSFLDRTGEPVMYDAAGRHGLSEKAGSFVAGILAHLDAILCLTAPSRISYGRLTPHRWSAAFNNLGDKDREASLRICPTSAKDGAGRARQFNVEYRAADAAANPHLALAALVMAGCQGIRDGLATPEATQEDLSLLDADALARRGYRRLPATLADALDRLEASATVRSWFPEGFADIYLAHKRGELAHLDGLSEEEACAAYAAVY